MKMSTSKAAANPPHYGKPISLAEAKRVMAAAEAEAARNDWPMVIAIVDSGAHLVMLHRMDQAQNGSIDIARLKAETAVNFRRETKVMEDMMAQGGVNLRILAMPNALPLEGGVPLFKDGNVVGAIGVSGMRSNQDAQVATVGSEAL
jgi:glc operon protein GlcG